MAYGWDFENRLVSATMTCGGTVVAHEYDADGNRVQTSVTASGGSAATTNMLVDTVAGLSQVVAETDGSGSLTALYIRNGDELLEVMRPAVVGLGRIRSTKRVRRSCARRRDVQPRASSVSLRKGFCSKSVCASPRRRV